MERKRTGGKVKNIGSNHVGRHQIRRTLNSLESEPADTRERLDRQRLGQAGHALEQGVASADKHNQELIDDFALADDHFGKLRANMSAEADEIFHLAVLLNISGFQTE